MLSNVAFSFLFCQGIDDVLALFLAIASGLTIEGVSIVFGNGRDVRKLGTNAKCALRMAGETSIPVYLGASGPLEVALNLLYFCVLLSHGKTEQAGDISHASHVATDIHGADGLGNMRPALVETDTQFSDEPASEFIYRTCSSHSGEINIITLGPLTNIAKVPTFPCT
jgi:inosine-uridine nucleoside N-ribohydrolase